MTDRGQEPIQLRPGSYDERAADVQPAQTSSALRSGESRRRFNWGEHPLAEVGLGVTSLLALAGWLAAGILIFMLVDDRDGPEGMTGLAVAFSMPQVLVVAFGFTAVAAFIWHRYWGGRVSLVVSIMVALAAAVVPCAWVAVVFQ
ncbi:hypothetical protein OG799_15440 [Micromonospora sp. NBC_00898]|uniref:hypothetical protein n=1 Tax=Micromonospora sp. NBC_00898 TaxID=2975981 RepID=UPI00386586E4|nr:hypothetical protein OG799_15440 [Micromonospora sp. NBC_00898]